MDEKKFDLLMVTRLLLSLVPLFLGWPMLTFCLCAQTAAVTVISRGPFYGALVEGIGAALVGAGCVICGYGLAYGCSLAFAVVLASSFCAFCAITKKPFSVGLLCASVSYGAGALIGLRNMADEAGLSVAGYMSAELMRPVSLALESSSLADAGMAELWDKAGDIIRFCAPAAICVESVLAGYVLMWLLSKSMRGSVLNNGHSFSQLRLGPVGMVFGIAMTAAAFMKEKAVCIVGINGALIFLFMSFCCGLSFVDCLMRKKVQRTAYRIILHCVILFVGITVSLVLPFANIILAYAIVGAIDSFVSLRKLVNIGNEKK